MGEVARRQGAGRIKCTLFRVPVLGDGAGKEVMATYTGRGRDGNGVFLTRKSVGAWVWGQEEWVGKGPVLCNK